MAACYQKWHLSAALIVIGKQGLAGYTAEVFFYLGKRRMLVFIQLIWTLCFITLFAAMALVPGAQAQTYATAFSEARWAVHAGPFACGLSHKVQGYGTAYFGQAAAGSYFFEFRDLTKVGPLGALTVDAVPPAWRTDLPAQRLLTLPANAMPLNAVQARAITDHLARGINLVFSAGVLDAASGDSLRVVVDARHFAERQADYQRCVAQLIPYTFAQLSRTSIHYVAGAQALTTLARVELDKIVRYAKADPKVLGIVIDAHSDNQDSPAESDVIAQQQATLVADYLIAQGLPGEMLTTRSHGDKFPVADNQTKAGQAKNRRVTLRLENAQTRAERAQKIAALRAAEAKALAGAAASSATTKSATESIGNDADGLTIRRLEQMVEEQNLSSGQQPKL